MLVPLIPQLAFSTVYDVSQSFNGHALPAVHLVRTGVQVGGDLAGDMPFD